MEGAEAAPGPRQGLLGGGTGRTGTFRLCAGPAPRPNAARAGGGRGRRDQLQRIWDGRLGALPAASASGSAAPASRRGPGQERVGGSIQFEDSKKNEVARDRLKEVAMTQAILDDAVELVLWTAYSRAHKASLRVGSRSNGSL